MAEKGKGKGKGGQDWGADGKPVRKEDGEEDKFNDTYRIEAEVVRRKRKVSKEEEEKKKDEFVSLDWDSVLPKKPKEKLRWLYKALEAARAGRLKIQPIFDIIVHRKFLHDLKGAIATDCLNLIRGDIELFSTKQKKRLTSDDFELFRKFAPVNVLDSDEDEADAPPLPPPPKVVMEPVSKKRKNKGATVTQEDADEGDSEDDLETKRERKLAKGVERRIDTDGQAYTLDEFVEEYGGTTDNPPDAWTSKRATSFIFKE